VDREQKTIPQRLKPDPVVGMSELKLRPSKVHRRATSNFGEWGTLGKEERDS